MINLRQLALQFISRGNLKGLVDQLGLEGVDRRSVEAMRAALLDSPAATPDVLLGCLYEKQVKVICQICGVDRTGRRRQLVNRLLSLDGADVEPAEASTVTPVATDLAPPPPAPAGMLRVSRTELVWPGKYDEEGRRGEVPRVSLPFQVIERVNESRATRVARAAPQMGLFDVYEGKEGSTFEDGWRNKLIWGDNLLVMGSLLERFAGKIDLIYIDPPFATGADFSFSAEIGDTEVEVEKEQSALEEKAYRDTWGGGQPTYLSMIYQRVELMKALLSDHGVIFLHLDPGMAARGRLLLDDVFGPGSFVNEIIWCYRGGGVPRDAFSRKHDVILFHQKGEDHFFQPQYVPYSEASQALIKGRGGVSIDDRPRDLERGAHMPDWWNDINSLQTWSPERTGYATQKPLPLIERIISAASRPGDLIADFFMGSGTAIVAAEKLGRRWIGCDLGRYAVHVSRKRLLDIPDCKPFETLNLGKYERQYWQLVTFEGDEKPVAEQTLYQYLAFILRLYGAQPVVGLTHLHGKKGGALVHIGAVDAPVTIDEINAALDECSALRQRELHVLGWEWEMGLAGPADGGLMQQMAKEKGVRLLLMQIPREVMETQAAAKGDVKFFELAYLEVAIEKPASRSIQVALRDFVIPNTELIPNDVRERIKKWSDYVDYWAVDWDFQDDTFVQGWVTYRTRRDRSLSLTSDVHTYEKPGRYRVLAKVVDIFGNDTSQVHEVSVS